MGVINKTAVPVQSVPSVHLTWDIKVFRGYTPDAWACALPSKRKDVAFRVMPCLAATQASIVCPSLHKVVSTLTYTSINLVRVDDCETTRCSSMPFTQLHDF